MGRKPKFIANCTDVIVTNCKKEGRLCSTPFYMVIETNGEIEEITSITINHKPLPPNLIRWIAVRRKRFQLYFGIHQATAEEIQQEREKEVFIEQEATQEADKELALEPTGSEVLETIGITGRAYHILPLEAEGTITPTAHQLELLDLHDGDNLMRIKLRLNRKNKKREYTCLIHIWKFDPSTRFVISDIDGTITRYEFWNFIKISNELNPEIISKFQELKMEGLVFLYVTIRAFASTEDTRRFLRSSNVPEGPVLTCPTDFRGVMRAYVAQRVCQLKLVHLYYLKSMFSDTAFYGAYGNTKADAQVYKSSAVNSDMIFNVAPKERPSMTETAKGFVVNVLDRFGSK